MILHTVMPLEDVMRGFEAQQESACVTRDGLLIECCTGSDGVRRVRRIISSDPAHFLNSRLMNAVLTPQERLPR